MRSRCARSMPACTLNTRPESGVVERARLALGVLAGFGGGREVDQRVEQPPHAEALQRRAEEHRRGDAREEVLLVVRGADLGEQRELVGGAPPGVRLLDGGPLRRHDLDLAAGGAARGAGVAAQLARLDLEHAAQVARDPERPGDRHGAQADRLLHLVEQLQRLAARAVPLVDERQHGDVAGAADVEQLERLRLEALRRVEQHHRRVDGGEHAVGVLGEVAVAGGVEQVDHVVAVLELQHRGGDGDAALLLHLHPVRRDPLAARLAVHRARRVDGGGVQGERLGQGGLARVRVADHRERPAPGGLAQDAAQHTLLAGGPPQVTSRRR